MGHMWSDKNANLEVGCRNEELGGQSRCGLVELSKIVNMNQRRT